MEKTKFTKSLAFKTMLRLIIIVLAVSLAATAVIGICTYVNMEAELRSYTYEAALKGTLLSSAGPDEDINKSISTFLETGKTDEAYDDLFLNVLLINDDYMPFLTRLRSAPTVVFIDSAGRLVGQPVVGDEPELVRKEFFRLLEKDSPRNLALQKIQKAIF